MKNIKWIIQKNLGKSEDCDKIIQTCQDFNYKYELIEVIPFDDSLPIINNQDLTIFYGATNFINTIYKSKNWTPGTFYNENFSYKEYIKNYDKYILNSQAKIITFRDIQENDYPLDSDLFIRPVKDLKEFAGDVKKFQEILGWKKNLEKLDQCENNPLLNLNTEIIISQPFNLKHEWRLFIVDGKVSSGSHYRSYMKLDISDYLPLKVIHFAEWINKIWKPADVFVLDIAESAEEFYVVECNCFNSSGFYASDIKKIIHDISNFVLRKYYK